MTVLLETNHFTELIRQSAAGARLIERLRAHQATAFTSAVSAQEVTEGWCAQINRLPAGTAQVSAYRQFRHSLQLLMALPMLDFDDESAASFHTLRSSHPRTGTMDLKIAAIATAHHLPLLTRNLRDFAHLPGLTVENWLD